MAFWKYTNGHDYFLSQYDGIQDYRIEHFIRKYTLKKNRAHLF